MDDRLETNRRRWDELVPIHAASRFYDVDAFLAGRCTLLPIERAGPGRRRSLPLARWRALPPHQFLDPRRRAEPVVGY